MANGESSPIKDWIDCIGGAGLVWRNNELKYMSTDHGLLPARTHTCSRVRPHVYARFIDVARDHGYAHDVRSTDIA